MWCIYIVYYIIYHVSNLINSRFAKGHQQIWEGPIADLMFVQWLKRNVRPLLVSSCRSFCNGSCVVHRFLKVQSRPSHKFINYLGFEATKTWHSCVQRLQHLSSIWAAKRSQKLPISRWSSDLLHQHARDTGQLRADQTSWLVGLVGVDHIMEGWKAEIHLARLRGYSPLSCPSV